ncbi:MAG: hypothetical protein Hyperionvirus2_145 [Hyperionvirus sp.]|uniref:Uncharacterized protein n=1 Tax=Hyperionvirus sp. TaxID=2487770 RepID=A0A3G5A6B4_9VIRU|nr:MAG: hypothetical protein Hyperionvirus2_145 [Hyperionvirus sp.]
MGNKQGRGETETVLGPFDFKGKKILAEAFGVDDKIKTECLKHIEHNENPDACYLLGLCYCGLSMEWDAELAMKYLEMAIAGGNKSAAVSYALFLYYGSRVSRYKWIFRMVALPVNQWHRIGRSSWDNSQNYDVPFGKVEHVKEDKKRSFGILSAVLENPSSIENLCIVYEYMAYHYMNGEGGIEKDNKKALDYLKISYNLVHNDPSFLEKPLHWPSIDQTLPIIKELFFKIGDFKSAEALEWMLKYDRGEKDYDIRVAKLYEARGDYDLAIKYCTKEIMFLKTAGTFDKCYEAKEYKKKLIRKRKELEGSDEIKVLRASVSELTAQVAHLTKLVPPIVAKDIPIVPAVPLVEAPPPYVG